MTGNRCANCMEEITSYPCPHCGSTGPVQKNPSALPPMFILNGQYLVGRVLGQGGFGITYLGCDLATGQKVAIKEFYPFGHVVRSSNSGSALIWSTTEEARQMRLNGVETFLTEARKMHQVRDVENVVHVLQVFSENETAYIVMDYIQGVTLKDHLQNSRRPLTWPEARSVFIPAIAAMAKMHRRGLVHRDLSPDNLMIQFDGTVTILDLGAAKDLTSSSGASMLVAKTGFSPMEQYTQRGSAGPKADVYAMAATLYYAVTGKIPTASLDRVSGAELRWDYPQLRALSPTVIAALQKAMALLPQDRTGSMDELLSALVEDLRQESQRRAEAEALARRQREEAERSAEAALEEARRLAEEAELREQRRLADEAAARQAALQQQEAERIRREQEAARLAQAQEAARQAQLRRAEEEKKNKKKKQSSAGKKIAVALSGCAAVILLAVVCWFGIHSWEPATCQTLETCRICGKTRGAFDDHAWKSDSCESPRVCTECGTTALGVHHEWTPVTCTEPSACSVCGKTRGIARGHQWVEDSSGSTRRCSDCGYKEQLPFLPNAVEIYPGVKAVQNGSEITVLLDVGKIKPYYIINKAENESGLFDWVWDISFTAKEEEFWMFAGHIKEKDASPSLITMEQMQAVLTVRNSPDSFGSILMFEPQVLGNNIVFTFTPPAEHFFTVSDMNISNAYSK